MGVYHAVTDEIISKLRDIVGERFATNAPEKLEMYKTDEEANPKFHHKPEVVVFPETTEQVAAIVKLANE